jgi:hypothetical protein
MFSDRFLIFFLNKRTELNYKVINTEKTANFFLPLFQICIVYWENSGEPNMSTLEKPLFFGEQHFSSPIWQK